MALDTRTLDLLVAKDSLREAQWVSDQAFAFLAKDESHFQIHVQDLLATRILKSTPIDISAPYPQSSFVVSDKGILALETTEQRLGFCANGSQTFHALSSIPAAAVDLHRGPDSSTFGWIDSPSGPHDALVSFAYQQHAVLHSQEGFIRSVAWHQIRPLFAFMSWEKNQVPWSRAHLYLGFSRRIQNSPHPELFGIEKIAPPGLETSPCSEFEFCGDQLLGTFQTDEFFQIWSYSFESKIWRQLTSGSSERSLPWRKVQRRLFTAHAGLGQLLSLKGDRGFWQMDVIDLSDKGRPLQNISLPQLSSLHDPQFSSQGDQLLLTGSGPCIPPAVFRLKKSEGQGWQLPKAAPLKGCRLQGEALSWPGFDGRTVHGILYRDKSRKEPTPLLMPLHGGPTDLVSAGWPDKAQAFVPLGYSVLYVNYRGSWGYGKSYQQALAGRWGQVEVDDAASAVQALSTSGWIDKSRVGLWGGGIASYSVFWALIRYPELFRAGVAVFPLLNLETFVAEASPAQRAELEWALGSLDPQRLQSQSPGTKAKDIKSALAIFHGKKDRSVPLSEIEALEASLKGRGVPCWTSVYPDEGSSWQQRSTYDDYYCKVASFFARFLRFPEK